MLSFSSFLQVLHDVYIVIIQYTVSNYYSLVFLVYLSHHTSVAKKKEEENWKEGCGLQHTLERDQSCVLPYNREK